MSNRDDKNKNQLDEQDLKEQGVSRRNFIKIVGLGVVAPTVLVNCGSSSSSDKDTTGGTDTTGDTTSAIQLGEKFFPQSVASGDPKPDTVILWTRAVDPDVAGDVALTMELSRDENFGAVFATQALVAQQTWDNVIKVKVSGLEAKTHYYYRFIYDKDGARYSSRTGRTKTAPTETDDTPVKYAIANCQDYVGRMYNSYLIMADMVDDLDFFVHLGDYIYETTGDPGFQAQVTNGRLVTFSKPEEAIEFKDDTGKVTHYAAKSLSNYRDLYKIVKADPWMQRVHEKLPMISIWDDHEFSDDCWRTSGTYFDGKTDEDDKDRAKVAEQAYWEYMPLDRGVSADGTKIEITKGPRTAPDEVLYRDFKFGKNLHVIMTDTRSYRPDHAISESAFYGSIVLDNTQMASAGLDVDLKDKNGGFVFKAYDDIDDAKYSAHKAELLKAVEKAYLDKGAAADRAKGLATKWVTGNLDMEVVNTLLKPKIDDNTLTAVDLTGLPRGMSYDNLHFAAGILYASDGIHSRYLVHKKHFEAWRKEIYKTDTSSQDVFGATQEKWLKDTLSASTATWKCLANSISMTPMIIDMRDESFPKTLAGDPTEQQVKLGANLFNQVFQQTPFLFNVDQWDGFPEKKNEVLAMMQSTENCFAIAGDIHSAYIMEHGKGSGTNAVFEFTTQGLSSESFKGFTRTKVDGLIQGGSESPPIKAMLEKLEHFLQTAEPRMTFASNDTIGFSSIEATKDKLTFTLHLIDEDDAFISYYDKPDELRAKVEKKSWSVANNTLTEG